MKNFEKELRTRMYIGFGFALIMILVNAIVLFSSPGGFNNGFIMGIYSGMAIIGLVVAVEARSALKNEEKKRKLYIKENDERDLEIKAKATHFTSLFILLGNIVLASIIMFFQPIVAYTIIGVSIETAILVVLSIMFFDKKI